MPEYLAPGVYVEETSFRAKSIEGVSTSTAGFVGPARYGPTDGLPELVTSFPEFERIFGSLDRLEFENEDEPSHNYLAHGVSAFFDNGGKRLYISRIYNPPDGADGHAQVEVAGIGITVRARFPGQAGESRVSFGFRVGGNVLTTDRDPLTEQEFDVLRGVGVGDVVWVADPVSPPGLPDTGTLMQASRRFDDATNRNIWELTDAQDNTTGLETVAAAGQSVHRVTVTVEVTFLDREGRVLRQQTWADLGFDPEARRTLGTTFDPDLVSRSEQLRTPIVMTFGTLESGVAIAEALLGTLELDDDVMAASGRSLEVALVGGSDGERPVGADYRGRELDDGRSKSGLLALEDIPDVSIVAAPGYSAADNAGSRQDVSNALWSHAERMQYRIAVLDAYEGASLGEVRAQKAQLDSSHAALYYPWVRVLDPVTAQEAVLPPSGFVAGIYARNDVEKGVHKAPANEVVRGALGFELTLNKAQQDVLNPEGINCFRFFEGRGNRLWGARTTSSDPEWKYVNLRRYFAYLERSIDRGTQWVVFENNGDPLWANVRRTIEDFLFNEWKQERLLGEKPEQAYFVKCDRTTMTQNDLDNGRLICLIGVAPVRPAEFVIFRIGQWTGDRKV